jgi:hypothetical protein
MERVFLCAALLGTTGLTLVAQGCDPQKRALQIFADQRLNILRPARDYIQPSGLVFLPKGGGPEYDDPIENVTPEKGNLTDFRAVILEETRKSSTGFAAALSLANWVLPVPLGLKAKGNSEVSLGSIETTGVRLQTTAIDAALRRPAFVSAVMPDLKRGVRVFVVQEVYRATGLDLKSTKGQQMDVSFNDGSAVAPCDGAATMKDTTAKPSGSKPEETKAGAKPAESKSGESKPGEPKPGESKQAESKPTETKPDDKATTETPDDKATLPRIGASVCITRDFSLKFTTKNPIAFAVRLAELEILDGQLRRKRGAHVINTTLGAGEISASLVDASEPSVIGIDRRKKP